MVGGVDQLSCMIMRVPYRSVTYRARAQLASFANLGSGPRERPAHRTSLETGSSTFKLNGSKQKKPMIDGDCFSSKGFGGLPRYWSGLLLWMEAFRITCKCTHYGLKHKSSLKPVRL